MALFAITLAAIVALQPPLASDRRAGTGAASTDVTGRPFVLAPGACTSAPVDVTIRDEGRAKDLELRVRIPVPPEGGSPPPAGWPLVVFSHGAGGSRTAFAELLEFWASHGYASVAVTHADSLELKRRTTGRTGGSLSTVAGRLRLLASVDPAERVRDCAAVLDRVDDIGRAVEAAGGVPVHIDGSRVAIAGHSAGALTAQLAAGVRGAGRGIGNAGEPGKIADPRFRGAIIISGQGTPSRLLDERSWSEVDVPFFVIGGSLDASPRSMGRETPESRRHPFEFARGRAAGGPAAYLLDIEGATHGSYQGRSVSALLGERPETDVRAIQGAVATGTTLFLDATLGASAEAGAILDGDRLRDTIPGRVRFGHK